MTTAGECQTCRREGVYFGRQCQSCRATTMRYDVQAELLRTVRQVLELRLQGVGEATYASRMGVLRCEQAYYARPEPYARLLAHYIQMTGPAWPQVEAAAKAVIQARSQVKGA